MKKLSKRDGVTYRALPSALHSRAADDGKKIIEGYFIVTNRQTELWKGAYETVSPDALKNISNADDVRALFNHDSNIVLGRTKAKTLSLEVRNDGLYGVIEINENDKEALDIYERVKRGDIDQCSFGFEIIEERTEWLDNGDVHWTIDDIRLHEVSVVTFPAYADTSVSARSKQADDLKTRQLQLRKEKLKERYTWL